MTDTATRGKTRRTTMFDRVTRGGRRQVNWRMAALLLAEGRTASDTATAVGVSRTSLWRRLKDNARFRGQVAAERARLEAEAAERVAGLRTIVADTIDMEVRAGNIRVILWLADRMNLLGEARAREEARDAAAARRRREAEERRTLERRTLERLRARLADEGAAADAAREPDPGAG